MLGRTCFHAGESGAQKGAQGEGRESGHGGTYLLEGAGPRRRPAIKLLTPLSFHAYATVLQRAAQMLITTFLHPFRYFRSTRIVPQSGGGQAVTLHLANRRAAAYKLSPRYGIDPDRAVISAGAGR
jgi:hypothetical protein